MADVDNSNRFDWSRCHEGQHWYKIHQEIISADDRPCYDAISFLRERTKDKLIALSVAFYPPKPVGTGTGLGDHYAPKKNVNAIPKSYHSTPIYGANAT